MNATLRIPAEDLYGLALVFGLLAGTLNGAAMGRSVIDFNADDRSATNTGQAILAIDISAFDDPASFRRRVDAVSRESRDSEKMKGFERIWLPGEQSHARTAERTAKGVPVPPQLLQGLDRLAIDLGIERIAQP